MAKKQEGPEEALAAALSRLAARSPTLPARLEPAELGKLAQRAYERWRPAPPNPVEPVVAVRVCDKSGAPREAVPVRQPGASAPPERTSAFGTALVVMEQGHKAAIAVGEDGSDIAGSVDLASSAVQRIARAGDLVVDARVVQLGEPAFPIKRPPLKKKRLRVALSGDAKRLAAFVPFFKQHDCFDLRAADKPGALSAKRLEDVELLVDLSGSDEVVALQQARASGKARWPTAIISVPHQAASAIDLLTRRFLKSDVVEGG